jgi:hypothetical protein
MNRKLIMYASICLTAFSLFFNSSLVKSKELSDKECREHLNV